MSYILDILLIIYCKNILLIIKLDLIFIKNFHSYQDLKSIFIHIGILFLFIFLITKYKTEFAKYNTTYIHSIISTIHISYCY